MAKTSHARAEYTHHISNLDLARIAGQQAAQKLLGQIGALLPEWRDQSLAEFEKAIGGCDDTPARLGAWLAGFNAEVLSALSDKGGDHE